MEIDKIRGHKSVVMTVAPLYLRRQDVAIAGGVGVDEVASGCCSWKCLMSLGADWMR